jgi:hypothetical protein
MQVAAELGLQTAWQQRSDVHSVAQKVRTFMERHVLPDQRDALPVLTVFHKAGCGGLGNTVYKLGRRQIAEILGLKCEPVRSESQTRTWTQGAGRVAKGKAKGKKDRQGRKKERQKKEEEEEIQSDLQDTQERGGNSKTRVTASGWNESGSCGRRLRRGVASSAMHAPDAVTSNISTPGDRRVVLHDTDLKGGMGMRLHRWDGSGLSSCVGQEHLRNLLLDPEPIFAVPSEVEDVEERAQPAGALEWMGSKAEVGARAHPAVTGRLLRPRSRLVSQSADCVGQGQGLSVCRLQALGTSTLFLQVGNASRLPRRLWLRPRQYCK